jgi:hypothetical protein
MEKTKELFEQKEMNSEIPKTQPPIAGVAKLQKLIGISDDKLLLLKKDPRLWAKFLMLSEIIMQILHIHPDYPDIAIVEALRQAPHLKKSMVDLALWELQTSSS